MHTMIGTERNAPSVLYRHCLAAALLLLACAGNISSAATLTVADIDARLNDLASTTAVSDPERQQLEQQYAHAREYLQAASRHAQAAAEYEDIIKRGPQLLKEWRDRLADVSRHAGAAEPSDREKAMRIGELQRVYDEAESREASLKNELLELESKERDLSSEPEKLRADRETVMSRISALETAAGDAKESTTDDTALAERDLVEAEMDARHAELRRLDQALSTQSIRLELVLAERAVVEAKLTAQRARLESLERLLLDKRRKAVESVIEKTQRAEDSAAMGPAIVRQVAAENSVLGRELSQVIEWQSQAAAQETQLEAERTRLEKAFQRTQERLKYAGYGRGVGQLLIEQNRHIPNPRRLSQQSEARKARVASAGLRSIEIEDEISDAADTAGAVERAMQQYAASYGSIAEEDAARAELTDAIVTQKRLLDLLARNYSHYLQTLGDAEFEAQRLAAIAGEYREFLATKISWIPNAPTVGPQMFVDAARALQWFFSPVNWRGVWSDLRSGLARLPAQPFLLMLLLLGLLGIRRPLARKVAQFDRASQSIATDKFRYTLGALVASILMSLTAVTVLLLLTGLLRAGGDPSDFSIALAAAFEALAPMVFIFDWLRHVLRENGFGQKHFHWRNWLTSDVQRATTYLVIILIPSYFAATFFEFQSNASYQYGMGRLAYIAAMVAILAYAYRLVHPDGFVARHLALRSPRSLVARLQIPIRFVALVLPFSFVVLAAAGYYYSALNLGHYLLQTGVLIVVAITLRSLAMRWLVLEESRLGLKRARTRREAWDGQARDDAGTAHTGADERSIDIATINAQTRMILSNVIGWSFAVGLYFIWQGALPAFGILESVRLWEIEVTGSAGTEFQQITLATLSLAGIIIAITLIAAKNLPGVLEIGLLQRLPLQPGSRYAITTLAQYVITAVGISFAFGALGARWSQIQWLVAALSVGLGFGLQEIVANFISGLILLFERPIRVGDTVTIGDLTGKVSRIRIRATTIIDWDNKEIVVPNKTFITERFVNWTLSDPITRVRINIGIAYGSNIEKALKILTDVPNAIDKVLRDPAPRALFLGFGDSSLNFEILLFIKDLNDRLSVIHEIHVAINREFEAAGIVIPFPQRDLHVRSIVSGADAGARDLAGGPPLPAA